MRYEKPVVVEEYFDTTFEMELHRVLSKYASLGYTCDIKYSRDKIGGLWKYSAVVIPYKR